MDKNTQELLNAGSDILKSVTKAIDTNDYSKLASEISETVKSVSIEKKTTYASGIGKNNHINVVRTSAPKYSTYPFLAKRVGKYNGIVEATLGCSFGAIWFLVFIGSLTAGSLPVMITMAAITAICGLFAIKGFRKLKFAKALYKYGSILKNAEYFKVSDLARAALETDEEVTKNLKGMLQEGYLPRGKFDSTETTFMITDAAYQMYLGAEQDRIAREAREAQEQAVLNQPVRANQTGDKVQNLLNEGKEYITFVRQINDIIPDTEEMSNKLYRLESIMNRIFEQVKKDPDTADDLHKLMNYYLPTTRKLLTAYVELDKQAIPGENIQQTKNEIDAVMDTINEAFEKLLDSLFQDMAWDISSDISVMKTMMAQDGLTSDGLAAAASSGASQVATASAGMAQAASAVASAGAAQAQEGIVLEFDRK